MPSRSVLVTAYRNRTIDLLLSLYESDGSTPFVLAANDNVRVKIGRGTDSPLIEVDRDASPAGSKTTFAAGSNSVTLRIAQGDTANLAAGSYDLEVLVIDDSESSPPDAAKHVQYGVFSLLPTMGGDISIDESSGSSSLA